MPTIEAISDGVDRSVETGRPVFMSMGAYAYLSGLFAAMTISSVNIMRYTYRVSIRKGATPIFMLPNNPEVAPLIDGIYREAAVAEGKPEAYKRENIYYFGNDEPAYRSGVLNLLAANPPATYILVGAITGTGDTIATWAARSIDTLIIGGTGRVTGAGQWLFYDYFLFLSDVFSAGTILSDDNQMKSSIIASDIMSWAAVVLALTGLVLGIFGLPFAKWISM